MPKSVYAFHSRAQTKLYNHSSKNISDGTDIVKFVGVNGAHYSCFFAADLSFNNGFITGIYILLNPHHGILKSL